MSRASSSTGARAPGGREGEVIAGVIRGLLDETGAPGVVLSSPSGPERTLLEAWLSALDAKVLVPEERDTAELAKVLGGLAPGTRPTSALAEACLAWARTRTGGWLTVGAETRTALLLDGRPPVSVHALGDLYATDVTAFVGSCTLPRALEPWGPSALPVVDSALREWLEERRPLARALEGLDEELRALLRRRLTSPLAFGRAAVVPKLRAWTAGVDPPR